MSVVRSVPVRIGLAAVAVCFASAEPAFAQAAGVGGDIGTFIENIVDLLNSNVIRGLAIIAIIVTGIAWMFGHLDMRRAWSVQFCSRARMCRLRLSSGLK